MAWTNNPAGCQHVQHGSFLALLLALHSAQLHVLDQRSDDVHLLFLLDEGSIYAFSLAREPRPNHGRHWHDTYEFPQKGQVLSASS